MSEWVQKHRVKEYADEIVNVTPDDYLLMSDVEAMKLIDLFGLLRPDADAISIFVSLKKIHLVPRPLRDYLKQNKAYKAVVNPKKVGVWFYFATGRKPVAELWKGSPP